MYMSNQNRISMEIDSPCETNGASSGTQDNGFVLYPVPINASGEGLPYAPVNWPNPGDNWRWKVGRRTASSGYYLDRYLYVPKSLNQKGKKRSFASKLSVEQYVQTEFPGADVNAFFASFSWKVPCMDAGSAKAVAVAPRDPEAESQSKNLRCRVGNKMCSTFILEVEGEENPLVVMPCDICCTEDDFCGDCCCILCAKTVDLAYGGYSYIRCEAKVGEGYICGHIAHLNCGLRAYMAGTVGGSIGLDAEYFCRRCDARTDLVSHATRLIQTCESVESRDDMEKILNLGICILRGTQRPAAKGLLDRMESARSKGHIDQLNDHLNQLMSGISIEDIWKVEDKIPATSTGASPHHVNDTMEATNQHDPEIASQRINSPSSDHRAESLELDEEIYEVLEALRKSQESEYKIAKETLYSHKNYLVTLYEQLDKERADLASRTSSADPRDLLGIVLGRRDQIKREVKKLKEMEEVAKGFGKTSQSILKEHFGFDIDS